MDATITVNFRGVDHTVKCQGGCIKVTTAGGNVWFTDSYAKTPEALAAEMLGLMQANFEIYGKEPV